MAEWRGKKRIDYALLQGERLRQSREMRERGITLTLHGADGLAV